LKALPEYDKQKIGHQHTTPDTTRPPKSASSIIPDKRSAIRNPAFICRFKAHRLSHTASRLPKPRQPNITPEYGWLALEPDIAQCTGVRNT